MLRRTLSLFTLLMVALVLLISACVPVGAPTSQATPGISPSQTTEEPQTAEENVTADMAEAEISTRTITDTVGHLVEVPADPQRIVTLSMSELQTVLALGVKPVGTTIVTPEQPFPTFLAGKTDGIEIVGTSSEPNLEMIVQLNPDIIIGDRTFIEGIYDQLSQIAPTILTTGQDWKEVTLPLLGEVLNKREAAEEALAQYNTRVAELRAALGDGAEDISISVVGAFSGSELNVYLKRSVGGIVLEDVGFARPPLQDVPLIDNASFVKLSTERLAELDADAIFVIVANQELYDTIQSSPVWQQLDAVQQGHVYEVAREHWANWGPLAALAIIDDLFKHLVEAGGF